MSTDGGCWAARYPIITEVDAFLFGLLAGGVAGAFGMYLLLHR